jgi:hypothetical protein
MKTYIIQNTKTGLYAKLDNNYNVCWDTFSTGGYGTWGTTDKAFMESQIKRLNLENCKVVESTTLQKEYKEKVKQANELIDEYTDRKIFGFNLLEVLESNYTEVHRIALGIYRREILEFSKIKLQEFNVSC